MILCILTIIKIKSVSINYNLTKVKDYVSDTLVGYAEVKINDQIYHKEPIYVKKEIKDKQLSWWQKFKRWLTKW